MFPEYLVPVALVASLLGSSLSAAQGEIGQECAVFVIHGETQEPIRSARVHWLENPPAEQEYFGWLASLSRFWPEDLAAFEEPILASGQSVGTDAEGMAYVPYSPSSTAVVVTASGLWGYAFLEPPEYETLVELWPDGDLAVQVIDTKGAPVAGVPVALRSRRWSSDHDSLGVLTRSDGIALLAHAATLLRKDTSRQGKHSRDRAQWRVALDLCLGEETSARIDADALPDAPIELILPPTGNVQVLLTTPDGRPVDVERPVVLLPATDEVLDRLENGAYSQSDGDVPIGGAKTTVLAGRGLFRRVGVGQELVVLAQRNGASSTLVATGPGPSDEAELARLEIVFGAEHPTFAGRIVDEFGMPLRAKRVRVQLISAPSHRRSTNIIMRNDDAYWNIGTGWLETDAEGGFALDYRLDQTHGGSPLLVLSHELESGAARATTLDLADFWLPGMHDLGAVVLPPAPLFVAGRVVDADGNPVEGATVSRPRYLGHGIPYPTATTDANGRFELRTAEPFEQVELIAQKNDSFHPERHVSARNLRRGADDVEIVLPTTPAKRR